MSAARTIKIGFIGSGQMAKNLARGFIQSGRVKREDVIASDVMEDRLADVEGLGIRVTQDNHEVVDRSDVVCLSVKPHDMKKVLEEVRPDLRADRNIIMSIAAGVPIHAIEQMLPPRSRVVRVMPNTPASVMTCASVYACGSATWENDGELVQDLLSSIGVCENVKESLMDALTGISGCGPAYMFMVIESLADGGVNLGIPRDCAIKLAAQTMLGAAKMVLDSGTHPAVLKDAVCSPGGSTIAAVTLLEKRNLRAALMEAVSVAAARSRELGAK